MKQFLRQRGVICLLVLVVVLLLDGENLVAPPSQALLVLNYVYPGNLNVVRFDGTTGVYRDILITLPRSSFGYLADATLGPDGNIYVGYMGMGQSVVLRYNSQTGEFMDNFAVFPGMALPTGITFGPDGNLYLCDWAIGSVSRANGSSGAFMGVFVCPGCVGLSNPSHLTFGPDGNLYVASQGNGKVLRYNGSTGAFLNTLVDSGVVSTPCRLAFGPDQNLYVLDTSFGISGGVYRFNGTTGSYMGPVVSHRSLGAGGMVFGPDGQLYVGDSDGAAGSVLRINAQTGAIIDAFVAGGSGGLVYPLSLLFSGATGPSTLQTTALFAHVAVGGGFTTAFTLLNTGNNGLSGNLILTTNDGTPMNVSLVSSSGSQVTGSTIPVSIQPGGTLFITATPVNPNAYSGGWGRVESSGGTLAGVATFTLTAGTVMQTMAGVLSTDTTSAATIPVDDDVGQNRRTGYAVANPGKSSISIKVVEVSGDGSLVAALNPISLAPGQQKATFFSEDPKAGKKFMGSAVLIGQNGATFCTVALVQAQGQTGSLYTAVPVIPSKAPNIN